MTTDGFEATFRVRLDRTTAWRRLTGRPLDATGDDEGEHLWLPGFDSAATVVDANPPERLRATKDDEPCAGTDIVVTLIDEGTGTRIHVVQSRFGDRLPAPGSSWPSGGATSWPTCRRSSPPACTPAATSGPGATSAPP